MVYGNPDFAPTETGSLFPTGPRNGPAEQYGQVSTVCPLPKFRAGYLDTD
jgi:hypothetical protein